LIIESCDSSLHKTKKCFTRICNKNSDCFSNHCEENACVTNISSPLYICKAKEGKYKCLKADQEPCKKNIECNSLYCDGMNICLQLEINKPNYRLIVIVALLLILFIILLCCCFKFYSF